MSISFSGSFTRAGGIASAIGKQLKSVNLKPVKKIVYTFDPFRPNVKTVRYSFNLAYISHNTHSYMLILLQGLPVYVLF